MDKSSPAKGKPHAIDNAAPSKGESACVWTVAETVDHMVRGGEGCGDAVAA